MSFELVRASLSDKAVLRRLLQLYHYDFSAWNGDDVDEHGEYSHRYLDHYFFVMRKYRRIGIGRGAAQQIFAMFPGAWQVRQLHGNDEATAFWRTVVPRDHEEAVLEEGPVQRFTAVGLGPAAGKQAQ